MRTTNPTYSQAFLKAERESLSFKKEVFIESLRKHLNHVKSFDENGVVTFKNSEQSKIRTSIAHAYYATDIELSNSFDGIEEEESIYSDLLTDEIENFILENLKVVVKIDKDSIFEDIDDLFKEFSCESNSKLTIPDSGSDADNEDEPTSTYRRTIHPRNEFEVSEAELDVAFREAQSRFPFRISREMVRQELIRMKEVKFLLR
jgi:hypothetical protein